MTTPNDSRHPRRVLVTLIITTATAAVTAGVALQKQPRPEAVVQTAAASPVLAGGVTPTTARVVTRREQWRDPWTRPAPLSESASIHDSVDAATTPSDPSLPLAGDALKGSTGIPGEPAPTF